MAQIKKELKKITNELKKIKKITLEEIKNSSNCNTKKAMSLYTSYVLANSIYEKFAKIILIEIKENYKNDLSNNNKILLLLKHRDGKKLEYLNQSDINYFLSNLDNEKIDGLFIASNKSLGDIKEIFSLLTLDEKYKEKFIKILATRNLTIEGLQDQLIEDYKNVRTKLVHGDFSEIQSVYFIYRNNWEQFMDRLKIAMHLMINSTYL